MRLPWSCQTKQSSLHFYPPFQNTKAVHVAELGLAAVIVIVLPEMAQAPAMAEEP